MLIVGRLDGYAGEDDITAIARFLASATDNQLEIPSEVSDWIVDRTKNSGSSAPPRLLSTYMSFLRNGASAPPFRSGIPGSPRYRILQEALRELSSQNTPICDLGVLYFEEIDDATLRQQAQSYSYAALRQHPWLIAGSAGPDSWLSWAIEGLSPDNDLPSDPTLRAQFPLISAKAKAGQLLRVRAFLSSQDLKLPVKNSSLFFAGWVDNGPFNWGRIANNPPSAVPLQDQASQIMAIVKSANDRLSHTLSMSPLEESVYEPSMAFRFNWWGTSDPDTEIRYLARDYTIALKLPQPAVNAQNSSTRLAYILAAQQSRLFALSSYALARARLSSILPPKDISAGDIFTELHNVVVPTSLQHTRIVPHIDNNESDPPTTLTLLSFTTCNPLAFTIQRRDISLDDLQYFETGTLTCKDHSQLPFKAVGHLSTDFAREVELNSDYFDLVGASLTLHDYTSLATAVARLPDDLDVVTLNPWATVKFSLALTANQDVKWQEVRDFLMQSYPRDLTWIVPGLQPKLRDYPIDTAEPSDALRIFSNSVRPPGELSSVSTFFFNGEINRLQAEARIHFANSLGSVVNGMPDTQDVTMTVCDNSTPPQCYPTTETVHTPRSKYLQQIRQIADSAKPFEQDMDSLGAAVCKSTNHMGGKSETLVDTQFQNFFSIYTSDSLQCQGGVEGAIPAELQPSLRQALAQDPSFFFRYGVDAIPSSDDMVNRLTTALGSVLAQKGIAEAGQQYLQASGLAVYLPSLQTPPLRTFAGTTTTLSGDPGGIPFPGDPDLNVYPSGVAAIYASSSPLKVALGPLLGSVEGTELAEDLVAVQNFAAVIPNRPYLSPYRVADSFWGLLHDSEASAISKTYNQVDGQVNAIKSQILPKAQDITVGITLVGTGGSVVPGFSFSYNGYGINIGANLPPMSITPILPGLKFPPLALPMGALLNAPGASAFDPNRAPAGVSALNAESELSPSDPVVFTSVPVGQPGWDGMLSQDNFVGRAWLQQQITLATPNLTPAQLAQIRQGLQLPTFPQDLAKIVATAASKSTGSLQGIALTEVQHTAPWVGGVCSVESVSHCAVAVNAALLLGKQSPQDSVVLAGLWGHAYDLEFDRLRKSKNIDRSTSDAEYIEEKVAEKLNPYDFAKDHANEELNKMVKKYLPLVGSVIEWSGAPWVVAFKEFFRANVAGTDYDDLETMDHQIQENFARQLDPYLNPLWKQNLNQATNDAAPQIAAPHVP
jgi:hypothetical protein